MAEFLLAEEGRHRMNYHIGVERHITDRSNPMENMTPEEIKEEL